RGKVSLTKLRTRRRVPRCGTSEGAADPPREGPHLTNRGIRGDPGIPRVNCMITTPTAPSHRRPLRVGSRLAVAAAAWSLAMAATGAWWLLVPEHYAAPSGDAGDSLVGLAEPALVSGAL